MGVDMDSLEAARVHTEAIDTARLRLRQLTAVAAEQIAEVFPGCLFMPDRYLSSKGDLFYFHILLYGHDKDMAFELPAELAVSNDHEAIRRFLREDPETVYLIEMNKVD